MKITWPLTGRQSVIIDDENWPIYANVYNVTGTTEPTSESRWQVLVRRHLDGRALILTNYEFDDSDGADEDCINQTRGTLLDDDLMHVIDILSMDAIINAIYELCEEISITRHHGQDAERWPDLAEDCIAELPALTLE